MSLQNPCEEVLLSSEQEAQEALWSLVVVRGIVPAPAARSWVLRNTSDLVTEVVYDSACIAAVQGGIIEQTQKASGDIVFFPPDDLVLFLDKELKLGIYEHYKSTPEDPKYYQVIGLSRHSETGDSFVVYIPRYPTDGEGMTVRPLELFVAPKEDVELNYTTRFRYVGVGI